MAIKIQTKTPGIPVEIGKLKFNFDTTDEKIKSYHDNADDLIKKMESIESKKGNEVEATKEVLKKGYDFMLGDGAFDKIYEQTPSCMLLLGYYIELNESIGEELKNMGLTKTQQQKVEKYLKNKNKK